MFYQWFKILRQGIPCLFHLLTGFYCPGCGGTRAVKYLFHGQIGKSIQYHPLVFYTVMVAILELISLVKARGAERPISHYKRYETWVWIGVAIILINWGVKNYMLAVNGIDLLP